MSHRCFYGSDNIGFRPWCHHTMHKMRLFDFLLFIYLTSSHLYMFHFRSICQTRCCDRKSNISNVQILRFPWHHVKARHVVFVSHHDYWKVPLPLSSFWSPPPVPNVSNFLITSSNWCGTNLPLTSYWYWTYEFPNLSERLFSSKSLLRSRR